MRIIAIDPGSTESAIVVYGGTTGTIFDHAKVPNAEVFGLLDAEEKSNQTALVIERIASLGMAVGADVFETVFWSGRFAHHWSSGGGYFDRLYRKDVKMNLCGRPQANDSNIRQALIDRWGGHDKAIGGKKCPVCKGKKATGRGKARCACAACSGTGWKYPPGPLAGITTDRWAALAVAVTYADGIRSKA